MMGCTISPVRGAAIHNIGTSSIDAPSVWKMRLTFAFCSAKPNWIPRNPKHMIGNTPIERWVNQKHVEHTFVQPAGAIDAIYAGAAESAKLGYVDGRVSVFAPTALFVHLCTYAGPGSPSTGIARMQRDDRSGVWSAPIAKDAYYLYLVDVRLPDRSMRQRVTDPYSVALAADGKRSLAIALDDPRLAVPDFDKTPNRIGASTDLSIYELHVRDFSRDDATVPAEHRGKYLAFTHPGSNGMTPRSPWPPRSTRRPRASHPPRH